MRTQPNNFLQATKHADFIIRHGSKRVAKAVLIASVPPLMLKTPANPEGTPLDPSGY